MFLPDSKESFGGTRTRAHTHTHTLTGTHTHTHANSRTQVWFYHIQDIECLYFVSVVSKAPNATIFMNNAQKDSFDVGLYRNFFSFFFVPVARGYEEGERKYVMVRCSVLQCVAVCCSVLQCVAMCPFHDTWRGCPQLLQPSSPRLVLTSSPLVC